MSDENTDTPTIELFLKASPVDPQEKGPCPISQKWFMAFFTMVQYKLINLRVTPVDLKNPPVDFVKLGVSKHLPVAIVVKGCDPKTNEDLTDLIADSDDEIENLMDRFKCPGMELGATAFKVTEDLFRNFNIFLQTNNSTNMMSNLNALNGFMEKRGTKFLQGDEISFVDCVVMPKLQHLRVACKEFKNFEIPKEFTSVWGYFKAMYETETFNISCPCDRDILIHYSEKVVPRPTASFLLKDSSITTTIIE